MYLDPDRPLDLSQNILPLKNVYKSISEFLNYGPVCLGQDLSTIRNLRVLLTQASFEICPEVSLLLLWLNLTQIQDSDQKFKKEKEENLITKSESSRFHVAPDFIKICSSVHNCSGYVGFIYIHMHVVFTSVFTVF